MQILHEDQLMCVEVGRVGEGVRVEGWLKVVGGGV
jgi:hypothetical protein